MNLSQIKLSVNLLALILGMMMIITACSTPNGNKNDDYLYGQVTHDEWIKKAGGGMNSYKPDEAMITEIREIMDGGNYSMLILAGSWCPDSRSEVPKIMKVMDEIGMSEEECPIYAVDREKRCPSGMNEKYNLKRVPTLVVLENGEEIGRIVEYPEETWEKDLLGILRTN